MGLEEFKDEDLAREQESKEERERMIRAFTVQKAKVEPAYSQPDFQPIIPVNRLANPSQPPTLWDSCRCSNRVTRIELALL